MGYYSDLMVRAYEACGKDAAEGIKSDPMTTAKQMERADRRAVQRLWWTAKVTAVEPHLGPGFSKVAVTYVTQGYEKSVIVFNGNYGIRNLSKDEARSCMVVVKALTVEESIKIEDSYQWSLNR